MKLLNTSIIITLLGAIQLVLIKPLEAAPGNTTVIYSYKTQLVQFYEREVNKLSFKYCVKLKDITNQILKNDIVQKAETPTMREFKANITQYEELYSLYTHLGLNKALLSVITHNIVKFYYRNDKDSLKILTLLHNSGYDVVMDQFEKDFMNFISTKFQPKFDEFQTLIPRNESKEWQNILKWGKSLKKCKSYECVYQSFVHFGSIVLTPREQFFAYINQQLTNTNLFYLNGTYHVFQGVLKHPKLKQLSREVQQRLIRDLQLFIQTYVTTGNLTKLDVMLHAFQDEILPEYLNNDEMLTTKDAQLLKEMFNEQGFAQVELNYKKKFQNFLNVDLQKEFARFQAKLSKDDLVKEEKLIDAIKHFKSLKSPEERRHMLTEIKNSFYGI